jgi:ketosteroid isomerase-like protein
MEVAMTNRAVKAFARPVMIVSLLGAGLGASMAGLAASPAPATAQQDPRAAVVSEYYAAAARGDVDAALALFADNAVFIGARTTGNCSTQAPCTDLAGIRQQLEGNIAGHVCQMVRHIEVSGAVVHGRLEVRADPVRATGVERALQGFMAVVPQDKITFLAMVQDVADPLTATVVAVNAGRQPPGPALPTPETPCAGM